MTNPLIEVLILAAIALFVLSRLYMALGKDDGSGEAPRPTRLPEPRRAPAEPGAPARQQESRPVFTGPAAGGLEEIYNADGSFDPKEFLRGAKAAYQMIVEAFARGDRETLRPLLDDDVYEAWDEAIAAREESGAAAFDLLRLKTAELDDARLEGRTARVMVRYEAELGDGERTRVAREIWTYMREVDSTNPNWILDDVETA